MNPNEWELCNEALGNYANAVGMAKKVWGKISPHFEYIQSYAMSR
jgi:hypothetical protein